MRRDEVLEKVLSVYQMGFPEHVLDRERDVGVEEEFPLVNHRGGIGHFGELFWVFNTDHGRGIQVIYDDIYTTLPNGFNLDGNLVITDGGFGTLEIVLRPRSTLHDMRSLRRETLRYLVKIAERKNLNVLGYGVQPLAEPLRKLWWPKGRYRVLVKQLPVGVDLATICASSQTHVKVGLNRVVQFVNVFNALSPLFTALTPNSPVWRGNVDGRGRRAVRNTFWHQIAERPRVGIPPRPFNSIEDMVNYLLDLRFIMYKKNGRYQKFNSTFYKFLEGMDIVDERWLRECLLMHEGCCWWDSRPRFAFGTVEVRVFCQQPPGGDIAVHAVVLGLACNISEAQELADEFTWEEWTGLRDRVQREGLQAKIRKESIVPYLDKLVLTAWRGLEKRGYGEEKYLLPLLERLYTKVFPSDEALEAFQKGGIEEMVKTFAYRL
jgi:gamma-glutamylcysteine synthetase